MNLSISTSQLELDPLLDTLTLEDGQLVIADESFEGAFLGMATPMSEIPVWRVNKRLNKRVDEVIHRVMEKKHSIDLMTNRLICKRIGTVVYSFTRRLEDLQRAQQEENQLVQENEMDVDFGPPMMEMDVPSPSRIMLTPPKARQHKRVFREVKTDLRVELSHELWKRQCTDLTVQVCKRPPLPCLLEWDNGMSELATLPTGYQDELQVFLQYHISIDTCLMKEGVSSDISSVSVDCDCNSM